MRATRTWIESPEVLLHQDHYTAEELAHLLDMPVHQVRHAAFAGDLRATIVDHHVICVRREDALAWLTTLLQAR